MSSSGEHRVEIGEPLGSPSPAAPTSGSTSPFSTSNDALLSLENAAQGIRRDILGARAAGGKFAASPGRLAGTVPVTGGRASDEESTLGLEDGDGEDDEFKDQNDAELHEGASHVHYVHRAPWLRAAVLGANDGILSTAVTMLGVGAVSPSTIILAGVVTLIGGALSMGIGEYVSVSSQLDTEKSDIERERAEHAKGPETLRREAEELVRIYMGRGLSRGLARKVVKELHSIDAVAAHVRDELGIDVNDLANPWTAALSSMGAFVVGAAWPVAAAACVQSSVLGRIIAIVVVVIVMLAVFGAVGAFVGGASLWRAAMRVCVGGSVAMGVTYGATIAAEKVGGIKIH